MAINQTQPWGPTDEARLLSEFDLSISDVHDRILRRAHAAASDYANSMYPPGAPGQVRYLHHVANLSEVLLTKPGWTRSNSNNIPQLIHADRRHLLVVTSGDHVTGLPWSSQRKYPKSKYPKGFAMQSAVLRNGQLALNLGEFSISDDEHSEIDIEGFATWFLMVHVGRREIRSEVSRPSGMNAKGHVAEWSDRILLPSIANDGTAIDTDFDDFASDSTPGIEIEIDRL